MWILTTRSPTGEPREYTLKPGKNTVGRKSDSDIVVADSSASRFHAEVHFEAEKNIVTLHDLNSTNGTFVNRVRLTQPTPLKPNDDIRIGECVINLVFNSPEPQPAFSGTRLFSRELLLESLDHHAVLMYEVARQLNMVMDIDTALREVSSLMKTAMGADKCEVILADRFDRLSELGFPTSIAKIAIEQRATVVIPDMAAESDQSASKSALLMKIRSALCVPVMSGEDIIALVYMYKTNLDARPFDQRDLQLAVAISHQAALTIQRMHLLQRINKEQGMRQLLQRFLSPPEAEYLMEEYQATGHLPTLTESWLTVLFADLMDSTGMAERMGVRRFGELLGRFYQDMTQIIFEHGGVLDKYMGDGIMAVFGMNQGQKDQ